MKYVYIFIFLVVASVFYNHGHAAELTDLKPTHISGVYQKQVGNVTYYFNGIGQPKYSIERIGDRFRVYNPSGEMIREYAVDRPIRVIIEDY